MDGLQHITRLQEIQKHNPPKSVEWIAASKELHTMFRQMAAKLESSTRVMASYERMLRDKGNEDQANAVRRHNEAKAWARWCTKAKGV